MSEVQSNFGAAVKGVSVQLRELFGQYDQSLKSSWEPVVKQMTDDGAQATFSGITGAGLLTRFSEGAPLPKKQSYKLYDTAFAHEQYGGQIETSRKMLMNRDFNQTFDEFKRLMNAAMLIKGKAPAQIFNGGFATTTSVNDVKITIYGDGKPHFSTIHPRVDGGTAQSNASATGITLTDTNVETGRTALIKQLQDDGNPIQITENLVLVVPIALEKQAQIITGSALKSGVNDNDINIYNGGAITVMSSRWLDADLGGSNTAWFLVAPSVAKLIQVMRTQPSMDVSRDKNTKALLTDVILDMSVGSYDWRGTWGSKGDGQAYSS